MNGFLLMLNAKSMGFLAKAITTVPFVPLKTGWRDNSGREGWTSIALFCGGFHICRSSAFSIDLFPFLLFGGETPFWIGEYEIVVHVVVGLLSLVRIFLWIRQIPRSDQRLKSGKTSG